MHMHYPGFLIWGDRNLYAHAMLKIAILLGCINSMCTSWKKDDHNVLTFPKTT